MLDELNNLVPVLHEISFAELLLQDMLCDNFTAKKAITLAESAQCCFQL
jgi:hypothetical protein